MQKDVQGCTQTSHLAMKYQCGNAVYTYRYPIVEEWLRQAQRVEQQISSKHQHHTAQL
jgi:hypothetical protein